MTAINGGGVVVLLVLLVLQGARFCLLDCSHTVSTETAAAATVRNSLGALCHFLQLCMSIGCRDHGSIKRDWILHLTSIKAVPFCPFCHWHY